MNKIIEEINNLTEPFIIGISGFGGSGKTTLSKKVSEELNTPIVCMDSFWKNSSDEYSSWDIVDIERLFQEVVLPFKSGKKQIEYGVFDWVTGGVKEKRNFENTGKLIIEGVGIFRPEIIKNFDYKIWVKTDLEKSLERGKERDKKDRDYKEDLAWDKKWDTIWKKNDEEFHDKYNPEKLADFIFENN